MRDYTIRIVMLPKELQVLKNALKSYRYDKDITSDLLRIIERQESTQNEKANKIETAC